MGSVVPIPGRMDASTQGKRGVRVSPSSSEVQRSQVQPLHVLQVFQPETGGVPRYVKSLTRGLLSAGWPVTVAGPEQALSGSGLAELGADLLPIVVRRSPHPLEDGAAVRKLASWCRDRDVALIHGHSTKASMLAALSGRLAGVPSVYTPHAWAFERLVPRPLRASYALYERELAHRYHAAIVAVSASERRSAERWRVTPRGRIRVIRTGLSLSPSTSRAGARQRIGLRPDEFAAIWVGRVGAQKRPHDLVRIAQRLQGVATVMALCDGLAQTDLADQLRAAGVAVLGDDIDPATAYAAADVLLHTSAWEACPLVVLEAMSAGLPVVAYDVGGLSEQVQVGRSGYLVAPRDIEMMCECVATLARRGELRAAMGDAGRQRIATLFDYSAMLDGFRDVYSAIVDGRPVIEPEAPSARLRRAPSSVAEIADAVRR
jgi:glycosyltransferase involved in cell wall biosynthesis